MEPLITKDQLADACRAQDNLADLGTSLAEISQRRGVDIKAVAYVAEQRALRMEHHLGGPGLKAMGQSALTAALVALWIDGLFVGLKCGAGK